MTKSILLLLSLLAALLSVPTGSFAGAPDDDVLQCNTTFFAAAAKNDVSKLKSLLSKGADLNDRSSEGFSALICAADAGATDAVKFLLTKGANPNHCTSDQELCPLWYAAMKNNAAIVELLIDGGAKLETNNGWGGSTILAWSVRMGKTDAARVLVKKGASLAPVIKNEYYGGKTAIELAKTDGHRAVVELIEAAANKPLEPTR